MIARFNRDFQVIALQWLLKTIAPLYRLLQLCFQGLKKIYGPESNTRSAQLSMHTCSGITTAFLLAGLR